MASNEPTIQPLVTNDLPNSQSYFAPLFEQKELSSRNTEDSEIIKGLKKEMDLMNNEWNFLEDELKEIYRHLQDIERLLLEMNVHKVEGVDPMELISDKSSSIRASIKERTLALRTITHSINRQIRGINSYFQEKLTEESAISHQLANENLLLRKSLEEAQQEKFPICLYMMDLR